jgi:hypothetical protein
MEIESLRAACRAIDRFIDRLIELELPLPDSGSREGGLIALHWSTTDVVFWFELDADDCGEIDELDAAILRGLDVCDWPARTVEGYADYVP